MASIVTACGKFVDGECWRNYLHYASDKVGKIAVNVFLCAFAAGIIGGLTCGFAGGIVIAAVVPLAYFIYATQKSEPVKGLAKSFLQAAKEKMTSKPITEEKKAVNFIERGFTLIGQQIQMAFLFDERA